MHGSRQFLILQSQKVLQAAILLHVKESKQFVKDLGYLWVSQQSLGGQGRCLMQNTGEGNGGDFCLRHP